MARRRPLATLDELREEAVRMRRGKTLAVELGLVRDGSESSEETRLRLALLRHGLPEPDLNLDLRAADGRLIARLDQAYPEHRVAVEYDGRQHAASAVQFERDAARWDEIRDEGWYLVRILRPQLRGDGRAAAQKVRAALVRAGWLPSA